MYVLKMYVCTICNLFAGNSFSTVLRHMGTHRFDPGLHIRCGIDYCTDHYRNFESYQSHVYRKHREALSVSNPTSTQGLVNGGMGEDEDGDTGAGEIDRWPGDERETMEPDPKRLAALFLLKTREERKITQVALDGIVQDFRSIWRDAMERLQVRAVRHGVVMKCMAISAVPHTSKVKWLQSATQPQP